MDMDPATPITLSSLPPEILLHILSFLDPHHITRLQLVSKQFRDIGRDSTFWRSRCFDQSTFLELLSRRRKLLFINEPESSNRLRQAVTTIGDGADAATSSSNEVTTRQIPRATKRERTRIAANWDPTYPSEKVSWYDEYIQRHAPVVVNWLEPPQGRDGPVTDVIEARGVALYRPGNAEEGSIRETLLAVSPLDDGSVCLWDIHGTRGKRGGIVAQSRPGILFIDGPSADNSRRSKRVDSGVTECVSVDSQQHRAFFAVQSHLIEVDLKRLSVVGCESYPWSITSLSAANATLPLTVGTSLGIHLHDSRAKARLYRDPSDSLDHLDGVGAKQFYERSLMALFDDDELPAYASLPQPGPLSILHLQRPGGGADISDDIYVAGRFSNILHYDRRKLSSIKGSIHSGASLCSMTSLPYPFSSVDSDLRRKGLLSLDQVKRGKSRQGGRTLIAAGEYSTKGSLELYGLCAPDQASSLPGGLQDSVFKNRQTSSQSKLLSVANHGTRLVFSDGSGLITWFERDGFTEVRREKIGYCERDQAPSLFTSMPGTDDIARKLLPTQPAGDVDRVNNNDLLFWTGEKLGLIGFSSRPGFTADDFDNKAKTAEEEAREQEERDYSERMRQALERQADDVRFVRNLGLGSGTRG